MKVALDTNAYSRLHRQPPGLIKCINEAKSVIIPSVVLGELLAGFVLGNHEQQNREELSEFLDLPGIEVIPIDTSIADRYGHVVKLLRQQGTPIPANDIWIAATALETGSRLVTYDNHFVHINGLLTLAP